MLEHHPNTTLNSSSSFNIDTKMGKLAVAVVSFVLAMACLAEPSAANFNIETQSTFGNERVKVLEGGRGLSLSLDQTSGSGFQSKKEYLFGRFDMQLKLVPDNSAGTVTTFYVIVIGRKRAHDEIDFEFLGNASGQPYTIHTNVYAQGKGNKEKQFQLWFDPTAAFHTYTIIWNPSRIIFMVDNSPIRVFNNHEAFGIPFPKTQPMRVYCSLWNADDWATQGGRVKTDWTKAPFVAFYRNLNFDACAIGAPCGSRSWQTQELDGAGRNRLRWVQQNHMVYDYCSDAQRFPQGTSVECNRTRF